MSDEDQDNFLIAVLAKARPEFAFVAAPGYDVDLPSTLVWVMIAALIKEKEMTLNKAAYMVHNFIERRSYSISEILMHATRVHNSKTMHLIENPAPQFKH